MPALVAGLGRVFAEGEETGRRGITGAEYVRERYSWTTSSIVWNTSSARRWAETDDRAAPCASTGNAGLQEQHSRGSSRCSRGGVLRVSRIYANLAPEFGLVIPLAGLGSLMALTGFFVLRRGATIAGVIRSIRLPLPCAVSFVLVRMLVYGESVTAEYVREAPAWVCTLVIAQALCLRPGFLQRFPIAMFAIGLPALRSLRMIDWGISSAGEEVARAAGSGPPAIRMGWHSGSGSARSILPCWGSRRAACRCAWWHGRPRSPAFLSWG